MKKILLYAFGISLLLVSCLSNEAEDGLNSLLLTSLEPAGSNCPTGGLRIDSGLDSNANGVLDTDEILATNYVCSGVNSLINIADELAGGTCSLGGIRVETGVDANGNGTLDEEEIQITRFLCNNDGGGFDEQIRLSFDLNTRGFAVNTEGNLTGNLPHFDKNFWVGVDSIIFIARPGYQNVGFPTTAFAEVFDTTNDQIIENSLISSDQLWNDLDGQYIQSENIFDDLPDEEIDLSIFFKSASNTRIVVISDAYLFLYRSN